MKKQIKLTLLFASLSFFTLCHKASTAQAVDSSDVVHFFGLHTGAHVPLSDMRARFGNNAIIGASYTAKLKSNWTFDFSYSYFFGNEVKDEKNYLENILTPEGILIDGNGEYAEVKLMERGWTSHISVGKIFPVNAYSRNSGIWFKLGAGILEHKIFINNPMNVAPQIVGDYKKGYDKLSNGFSANSFLGYIWLNKRQRINGYAGIDFNMAWTKNRRSIDFVAAEKIDDEMMVMMLGIKAAWVIPVYKRKPEAFYFR